MRRTRPGIALALGWLVGCAHYELPDDVPPEQTAHVVFTRDASDMLEIAFGLGLYVTVYDLGEGCPKRGLLDLDDSLGTLGFLSKGEVVELDVPAGRHIFLDLDEREGSFGISLECGLAVGWVPVPGHRYELEYSTNGAQCRVTGRDTTTDEEVPFFSPDRCTPIGGGSGAAAA